MKNRKPVTHRVFKRTVHVGGAIYTTHLVKSPPPHTKTQRKCKILHVNRPSGDKVGTAA